MASRRQEKQRRREARETKAARAAARGRRRILGAVAGAVALVAVIAVVVVAVNRSGSGAAPVAAGEPVHGAAGAPVTIVEYGDFKCPNCASFFNQTEPQIRREYVERGKVRLVWRDFPNIDSESAAAAAAARCAGRQGRFWQYHDALYGFIITHFWARGVNAEGARAYTGHYDQIARQAGVRNLAAFGRCVRSGRFDDAVRAARDDGVSRGVDGTPTFFVNGQRLVGAQPYSVFRRLIDAALGGS